MPDDRFYPGGVEEIPELCIQIMQAEGSTFHERYRDRENLYGSGFRERILPGRDLKALTYLKPAGVSSKFRKSG